MRTYSFSLILAGIHELKDEVEDALFEAGCDDALLGVRSGAAFLDFDREARSFPEAVLSAVRDVAASRTGARVVRIEPDDPVSASEIARRSGRTRSSIRLLIRGDRGPGGIPPAISNLMGSSPLWSWAEVAHWMASHEIVEAVDRSTCADARFVALVNAGLGLDRRAAGEGYSSALAQVLRDLQSRPRNVSLEECLARAGDALAGSEEDGPTTTLRAPAEQGP